MFILIIVSLLAATQIIDGRQCASGCTLVYSMNQSFVIPDDEQCKRETKYICEASVTFDYINGKYTVEFPDYTLNIYGYDNIKITSEPRFEYTITYVCSNGTDDCAVQFLEKKIPEMIGRNYRVFDTINELSTILDESSSILLTNNSLNCYYDTYNTIGNIGICSLSNSQARGQCQIEYNQWSHVVRSHKCDRSDNNTMVINVYDSESKYASLTITCNKDLCNSKWIAETVIQILAKYNVTDTSGGTGRGGARKLMASQLLILLALILAHK